MMAFGLLRAAASLHAGFRRQVPMNKSVLLPCIYLIIFTLFFGPTPIVWGSSPAMRLGGWVVGIAAEVQETYPDLGGEAAWDTNYVFKPSPVFWKPLSSLPAASFPPYDLGHHDEAPHRLIFASCNRQPEGLDAKHDAEGRRVWRHISQRKPRAFLWMGDNVYADHMQLATASDSRNFLWKISEGKKPIPPPGLLAAYTSQLTNKEYRDFVAEVPGLAGTWDDHDMGEDNANKMYTYKHESKEAMLDFLGVDESAAIRSLEWKGVYSSHDLHFGEDLHVKVIFLDLRFEKDSWWLMDLGDMLGEQQWSWLQQELQLSTADINIVVSSLQVFANHRLVTETWSHFPWARERLFALLAGSGAKTPIVLSGDTHYAEFAAMHCQRLPEAWSLDEPQLETDLNVSDNRITRSQTPQQQLRRLAVSDLSRLQLEEQQRQQEGGNDINVCDPSEQCCSSPSTRSALFWWVPRHLPFFLLVLFRAATNAEVFAPRQRWRRPRGPAFSGAFPPPPFAPDEHQVNPLPEEDRLSTYLFDMTSSGLGHGVPESMCRAASAMIELAIYFLTEGVPFSTTMNADITGPRLLYAERNFGELEFIENPLHLVLFSHAGNREPSVAGEQALLERRAQGDTTSRIQLLRVREKHAALRELRRQQELRRPLQAARLLTNEIAVEFRSRLRAYKEQRQGLVNQLRAESFQQLAVIQRLKTLSARFEAYVQTLLGGNRILFEQLLHLHLALLLAYACEDEGASHGGGQKISQNRLLFGSCSLLMPWGSLSSQRSPKSLADAVLWWLWDLLFGLSAHRAARSNSLPMGDAAILRLSAAVDHLMRMSAAVRAAAIADAAIARRVAYPFVGRRLIGARGASSSSQQSRGAAQGRLSLRRVFAAAGDGLLRKACVQLQSPRREQQRDEIQQLFQRGVANQPPDGFAFAVLDDKLKMACSLVDIPPMAAQSHAPSAYPAASQASAAAAGDAARAVADTWILVELLETKVWVLSRTFDVVTGRLVKEKLLSSFASEQQQRQHGIGQWACQGWKGNTERQMYLFHLSLLVAALLTIGTIVVTVIFILRAICRTTANILLRLGRLWCMSHRRTSDQQPPSGWQVRRSGIPQRQLLPTQKVAAAAAVAIGAAAVILCTRKR